MSKALTFGSTTAERAGHAQHLPSPYTKPNRAGGYELRNQTIFSRAHQNFDLWSFFLLTYKEGYVLEIGRPLKG